MVEEGLTPSMPMKNDFEVIAPMSGSEIVGSLLAAAPRVAMSLPYWAVADNPKFVSMARAKIPFAVVLF